MQFIDLLDVFDKTEQRQSSKGISHTNSFVIVVILCAAEGKNNIRDFSKSNSSIVVTPTITRRIHPKMDKQASRMVLYSGGYLIRIDIWFDLKQIQWWKKICYTIKSETKQIDLSIKWTISKLKLFIQILIFHEINISADERESAWTNFLQTYIRT